MFQFVIYWHFFVIDGERPGFDAALVLLRGMGAEFASEDVENLLANPAALRERREGEVIRIHFT